MARVYCMHSFVERTQSSIREHAYAAEKNVLVPSKGLEPPHRCRYMDLNHARLPIPPRWLVDLHCSGGRMAAVSGRPTSIVYRHDATCQTKGLTISFVPFVVEVFESPKTSLPQLRTHRNLSVQHLRHRTSLLRCLRVLLESRRISARDFPYHINMARRNCPSRIQFVERQRDRGRNALWSQVRPAQLRRQRHRKTSRMCRRNQFFGIRPCSILKPRRKRIRSIFQHPARRRNCPFPI